MFNRKLCLVVLVGVASVILVEAKNVLACEMCTIPRLGRQEKLIATEDSDSKWFFEFLAEEQNWDKLDPVYVHGLHHSGHDVHDKTKEYFYHYTLGRMLSDHVAVALELPYVVKHSLGIDHATLGRKETSEGLGDLSLMASYRVIREEKIAVSAVGGVKFPTGETGRKDTAGNKFEPELQPGTGSYDLLVGGVLEHQMDRVIVKGNITYSFKNEGEQDYKFGDIFSTSLFVDYIINPKGENFKAKAGVDVNYQLAQKDESSSVKDPDSGGHTILAGPTITVEGPKNTSLFINVLFPVMQDLGGVHQELDYTWTAGGKINF